MTHSTARPNLRTFPILRGRLLKFLNLYLNTGSEIVSNP